MVSHDVLEAFQIAPAYVSGNFENFQNIIRVYKSRNALAFMRFPIHIVTYMMYQYLIQMLVVVDLADTLVRSLLQMPDHYFLRQETM